MPVLAQVSELPAGHGAHVSSLNSKCGAHKDFKEEPEADSPLYSTDEFRMYCFKVLPCSKRYCHDWTVCPFAHPGERAKRRDPRVFQYAGIACPEMKKVFDCPRGDGCPYAHNVFEYWLHPSRYRSQLCNDGVHCRRKVCFFAHTLEELRIPTDQQVNTSPLASPQMVGRSFMNNGSLSPLTLSQDGAIMAALQASPISTMMPPDAWETNSSGSISPSSHNTHPFMVQTPDSGMPAAYAMHRSAPVSPMMGAAGLVGALPQASVPQQIGINELADQLASLQFNMGPAATDPTMANLLQVLLQEVRHGPVVQSQPGNGTMYGQTAGAPPRRASVDVCYQGSTSSGVSNVIGPNTPALAQMSPIGLDNTPMRRRAVSVELPRGQMQQAAIGSLSNGVSELYSAPLQQPGPMPAPAFGWSVSSPYSAASSSPQWAGTPLASPSVSYHSLFDPVGAPVRNGTSIIDAAASMGLSSADADQQLWQVLRANSETA